MATFSKNLSVTSSGVYTLEMNLVPTGSTVTPVNDIQTWLHCANIWNKNYTTISQVLADTSTFNSLIQSNNAVDYMARSTNWASSVVANQTAMTYIGANNYCATKLLSNATWCAAICNSTYFDKVLTTKVPTMTSNTAPSGECYCDDPLNYSYAYNMFDGVVGQSSDGQWRPRNSQGANKSVAYGFTSNVAVKRVKINLTSYAFTSNSVKAKVQGSNSKTSGYIDVSDELTMSGVTTAQNFKYTEHVFPCTKTMTKYKYYRLLMTQNFYLSPTSYAVPTEIQFHGRT